jgi:hypothetical protein
MVQEKSISFIENKNHIIIPATEVIMLQWCKELEHLLEHRIARIVVRRHPVQKHNSLGCQRATIMLI